MLHDFLLKNEVEILGMTERKTLELAGVRPTSAQLKQGLPIFYKQLISVLRIHRSPTPSDSIDRRGMANAAREADEQAMAKAAGRPDEVQVAKSAGLHGTELLRLGYTLSHVVHAYGAMCQSITELATSRGFAITANEFHDLNRCLDIAIAGAVTEFQSGRNSQVVTQEYEHLGFLAHELRNALTAITVSLHLIKAGTVGFGGSTGSVLDRSLKRMEGLIDRSLTEVRLSVDPTVHAETGGLLRLVDQIIATAEVEARARNQVLEIHIDPALEFEADHQLLFSAISNLVQNALKYTREGGRIQVRGELADDQIIIEVEDECGGLPSGTAAGLFEPHEQRHQDRKGIGFGLTIARRAIELNHGTIEARNLGGKGCVFRIAIPRKASANALAAQPAA